MILGFEQFSVNFYKASLVLYFIATVAYFMYLAYRSSTTAGIATGIGTLGVITHLTSILFRWKASGHTPLSDMYEYTSMFALAVAISFLAIQVLTKNKTFGGFSFGIAFILLGVALLFYKGPQSLLPALQSYWLEIHVLTMVISSGTLGVAFLLAVLYLIKEKMQNNGSLKKNGILSSLPSLDALDNLSYRTTAFGFPLWTIGIIAGGVWAEEAWGRYWGWDPKETWSFITWLIYAGYLHARVTAGWRGRSASYLSAIGFAAVLFTFFAVNLVLSGLHSYG